MYPETILFALLVVAVLAIVAGAFGLGRSSGRDALLTDLHWLAKQSGIALKHQGQSYRVVHVDHWRENAELIGKLADAERELLEVKGSHRQMVAHANKELDRLKAHAERWRVKFVDRNADCGRILDEKEVLQGEYNAVLAGSRHQSDEIDRLRGRLAKQGDALKAATAEGERAEQERQIALAAHREQSETVTWLCQRNSELLTERDRLKADAATLKGQMEVWRDSCHKAVDNRKRGERRQAIVCDRVVELMEFLTTNWRDVDTCPVVARGELLPPAGDDPFDTAVPVTIWTHDRNKGEAGRG